MESSLAFLAACSPQLFRQRLSLTLVGDLDPDPLKLLQSVGSI